MRNSPPIAAVLNVKVVFLPDDRDESPLSAQGELELSRLLLRQVTETNAALSQLEELQGGASPAQPIDGDELGAKEP
jgi:hypothetical protein